MPKIKMREDEWRCSWDCGFQDTDLRTVMMHERKKHPKEDKGNV